MQSGQVRAFVEKAGGQPLDRQGSFRFIWLKREGEVLEGWRQGTVEIVVPQLGVEPSKMKSAEGGERRQDAADVAFD